MDEPILATTDLSRHHDKRKVEGDDSEELIQPKRIRQPIERDLLGSGTKRKPWTISSRRKADGSKRLERKDTRSRSPLSHDEDNIEKILSDIKPQEIEKLRQNLQDGNSMDIRFNWIFWNLLNSTYGSPLGYAFGFILIILRNKYWMWEEFAGEEEGHSVSKVFVILFVIFGYSFITLGFEVVQLIILVANIYYPNFCVQFAEEWREHREFMWSNPMLRKWRSSKYFVTPFAVLWCIFTSFVGSETWVWFWWNHICKSYHDRTCRKSWIGKLARAYRDQACYDGTASSAICEKFVSYFPIMIFCVIFVLIGNVILPVINDWLSMYYPVSPKLEAAFDIMQNMTQISEKEESPTCDFTFKKTFSLDDDVDAEKEVTPSTAGSSDDEHEHTDLIDVGADGEDETETHQHHVSVKEHSDNEEAEINKQL